MLSHAPDRVRFAPLVVPEAYCRVTPDDPGSPLPLMTWAMICIIVLVLFRSTLAADGGPSRGGMADNAKGERRIDVLLELPGVRGVVDQWMRRMCAMI